MCFFVSKKLLNEYLKKNNYTIKNYKIKNLNVGSFFYLVKSTVWLEVYLLGQSHIPEITHNIERSQRKFSAKIFEVSTFFVNKQGIQVVIYMD